MKEAFDRLEKSATVMIELFPFLLYRLAVYGAVGLAILTYWALVLGLIWIGSAIAGVLGVVILLVALGVNWGLLALVRNYLLYVVNAGYIAVLTQVVAFGSLPAGVSQTKFAKDAVAGRFKEVSVLAAVDELVKGVVRAFNATLEGIASILPVPGLDQVVAIVNAVVRVAATNIDEVVLSLAFLRKEQNIWEVARDGVLLYAQNWKTVLTMAAALVVVEWALVVVCALVLLTLLGLPTWALFPPSWPLVKTMGLIVPLVLTYVIRLALIHPLVVTALLLTFHQCIKGQKIDPSWDAKLTEVSDRFRTLKERALGGGPAVSGA
ncbi:MAG: hypothetical protein HY815_22855 [Candidatus Riflebacteria bacterium]|nr:hypothetical protein [Candidatus Riflebacteria bacterium]